jgi:hypothetical protein
LAPLFLKREEMGMMEPMKFKLSKRIKIMKDLSLDKRFGAFNLQIWIGYIFYLGFILSCEFSPGHKPEIFDIVPERANAGEIVKILGKNLDSEDTEVFFDGISGTIIKKQDTSLDVVVPYVKQEGAIVVILVRNKVVSEPFIFQVTGKISPRDAKCEECFKPPFIFRIEPEKGQIGEPITIYGENFGFDPSLGQVTFAGIHAKIKSWNNFKIVVLSPGVLCPGMVKVRVNGKDSNLVPFNMDY